MEFYQVAVQPLAVRLFFRIVFFQLLILENLMLHGIDQQHFSGMQALLEDDLLLGNRQNAHLGGEDHVTIFHNVVTGRTEAVPVKNRTHHIAIGKQNGSRAVPGLHHGRIILIKITFFLGNRVVVGPGLRNRHHDGQRKLHAAHNEEFQRVVQHGGVRTSGIYHRKHLVELSFQMVGRHGLLTGQHFVGISADRVDLTVVNDKTVRMGSLPARIGVGTETGMNHGDGRLIIRILQVCKEGPKLSHQKHTFVYNRPAGHGNHIGVVVALLENSSCDVELPVKIQTFFHALGPFQEGLHDIRHAASRFFTENFLSHRHFTEA